MLNLELETQNFYKLIRAISLNGEIDSPVMQFMPERMRAKNVDVTHTIMSLVVAKTSYFIEYNVSEGRTISFDASKLLKIGKLLGDDIVHIEAKPEDTQLRISTKEQKITVPILEEKEKKLDLPFISEKDENIEIIEPSTLKEKIPTLKQGVLQSLQEDDTRFNVRDGKMTVEQEAIDGYSFAQELTETQAKEFSVTGNATFLKAMFGSVIGDEVEIHLTEEKPILLKDKGKNYDMVFVLAPKIEEE